ncbi:MAG: hypothetical protein HZA83_00600 [Thaumarchaeota archaeon]|nr:hypothetical protein [Nitrososphaerota archaeon]
MSSNNVKIKVKFGVNEVEIESPLDSIREAVDAIPSIIRNLGNVKAAEPVASDTNVQVNGSETKPQIDVPEIKIEKGDSLSDVVVKMFKESWGKQSKRLSDVRQVLDTYGLSYPKQSVAVTLMRLAQSGKLRRFKGNDGEFIYTAASILFPDGSQVTSDLDANRATEGQ